SEKTATVRTPSSRQARITRSAISPRLAISTLRNISDLPAAALHLEGEVGGGLDPGGPQLELRGAGCVVERHLLADEAAAVQVHQTLIERLHPVLRPPFRK